MGKMNAWIEGHLSIHLHVLLEITETVSIDFGIGGT
jgi:hypothetical protein